MSVNTNDAIYTTGDAFFKELRGKRSARVGMLEEWKDGRLEWQNDAVLELKIGIVKKGRRASVRAWLCCRFHSADSRTVPGSTLQNMNDWRIPRGRQFRRWCLCSFREVLLRAANGDDG